MPSVIADVFSWSLIGIPAFLFVITVVVFFHELGHFSVARYFGVTVEAFSIGFGRELFGWNDRKGTRWKICLLPLGGYVKFAGDANAASQPDEEEMRNMNAQQRAGVLHYKPLYQRALVVAAGPIANFILGILIFAAIFMVSGKPAEPPIVNEISPQSAAEEAGLMPGDIIRAANGETIHAFSDFQRLVGGSAGQALTLGIERGGQMLEIAATPDAVEQELATGGTATIGRLGITNSIVPVGPVEAIGNGAYQSWLIVSGTISYLGQMITGQASPDQLAGPIGIAKVSGDMASIGFFALINLAGLLSISIGLINLFPIPVLDGGHLLYYGFEAVLGRPLGERAQEFGYRLGLAFVLSLMLLATFNDLVRFDLF
jgi:regulator of sigma E protease